MSMPLRLVGGDRPARGSDVCTVIGTAACVREDIRRHGVAGDVMCIAHALFAYVGPVSHFATRHARIQAGPLLRLRCIDKRLPHSGLLVHVYKHDRPSEEELVGLSLCEWLAAAPPLAPADSGHFGILAAVSMGYTSVRLLGMPMDGQEHFYDLDRSTTCTVNPKRLERWVRSTGDLLAGVRSAGGNTRRVFGGL